MSRRRLGQKPQKPRLPDRDPVTKRFVPGKKQTRAEKLEGDRRRNNTTHRRREQPEIRDVPPAPHQFEAEAPINKTSKQIDLGYTPRKYFIPFHQRPQRFACTVAHRRAGKTVAALVDTLHRALSHPVGANGRYAFCGPTYSQIKDVVWSYLKQYTYTIPGTKVNESALTVQLLNTSQIKLYSLDSTAYDRMRGVYLDGCTIDEFADCDPRALPEVIRPALADRQGWLSVIGTSKGRDQFWKLWMEAQRNPEWFTLKLKASDTNAILPGELEHMRSMMGPNEYARELECSFDVEGVDQFISGALIEEARQRMAVADPQAPIVFGLDVARFGDDRTALVIREGRRLIDGRVWREQDLMQTAQQVKNLADLHKPRMIFVDGVGVGAGVIDRLRHLGYTNVEDVNVGRRANADRTYHDLRAECYGRLKEWLLDKAAIHERFPYATELEDDLTVLSYKYDTQGRLQLETKDELKKQGLPSPDVADALSLTFAELFPTYDVSRMIGAGRTPQAYAQPIADPLENY